MKKLNYLFALICAGVIFSSCGVNRAPFQDYPATTEVQLNQANYRIIGTAQGYSRQVYVFGIGGLSKKALRENAITDMYENANLKGSQAIVNITTALTWSGFPIICTVTRASARGTIIEFLREDGRPIKNAESPYESGQVQQRVIKEEQPQAAVTHMNEKKESLDEVEEEMKLQQLAGKDVNKFYIAYLYKSKKLNDDRSVLRYFSWDEISLLTQTWTVEYLRKNSKGHDVEFERYALKK